MSNYDLTVGQVASAQGSYVQPENEDPPKTSTGSVSFEAGSKNGIGGSAGVNLGYSYLQKGTVFDKGFEVKWGGGGNPQNGHMYVGANVKGALYKNITDDISVYGSLGIDGRVAPEDYNIAQADATAYNYYKIPEGTILVDEPTFNTNASAQGNQTETFAYATAIQGENGKVVAIEAQSMAHAETAIVKHYMDTELGLGFKYEDEDGYFGLEFNAGMHAQVLPTASTLAIAELNVNPYSVVNEDYTIDDYIEVTAKADAFASTKPKLAVSPYVGGQLTGKANITPRFSVSWNGGAQVNTNNGEVRPFLFVGGTVKLFTDKK